MKLKTEDLTGAALDWAVCLALGRTDMRIDPDDGEMMASDDFEYSTDWAQGGAIIERELITLDVATTDYDEEKDAVVRLPTPIWYAAMDTGDDEEIMMRGETPLIAAMRCYVASKLGDEVDVPEELK